MESKGVGEYQDDVEHWPHEDKDYVGGVRRHLVHVLLRGRARTRTRANARARTRMRKNARAPARARTHTGSNYGH